METCLFSREFPSVFLRIEFPCILQWLSLDERCGLSFIEPDKAAEVFDTEHFTEIGKPCRRPCDYRFQKRYFLLVPCVLVGYFPAVPLLHFPYLPAVVCLHGLYPILQASMVSSWSATSLCRAVFSLSNVLTLLLPKREPTLLAMLAAAVVAALFSFSVCISFFARV